MSKGGKWRYRESMLFLTLLQTTFFFFFDYFLIKAEKSSDFPHKPTSRGKKLIHNYLVNDNPLMRIISSVSMYSPMILFPSIIVLCARKYFQKKWFQANYTDSSPQNIPFSQKKILIFSTSTNTKQESEVIALHNCRTVHFTITFRNGQYYV